MNTKQMVRRLIRARRRSGRMIWVKNNELWGEQNYDCEVNFARYLLTALVRKHGARDTLRLLRAAGA